MFQSNTSSDLVQGNSLSHPSLITCLLNQPMAKQHCWSHDLYQPIAVIFICHLLKIIFWWINIICRKFVLNSYYQFKIKNTCIFLLCHSLIINIGINSINLVIVLKCTVIHFVMEINLKELKKKLWQIYLYQSWNEVISC